MQVLIVDDHALIRSGLLDLLESNFPDAAIGQSASTENALELLAASHFDLVVTDLFFPGEVAFGYIRKLCDTHPEVPVLVVSASEVSDHVYKCIDLGCSGFVPKSAGPEATVAAVKRVLSGGVYMPRELLEMSETDTALRAPLTLQMAKEILTQRQLHMLLLVTQGKSNKEIARETLLSENTIKVHISAILKALNLNNRTQAGLLGQQLGLSSADVQEAAARGEH